MLKVRFPLQGVRLERVRSLPDLNSALYTTESMQVNQDQCRLVLHGFGTVIAESGKTITYCVEGDVYQPELEAVLAGLPLAAILHQRGLMPFHAGSFVYNDKAVLVLGQSGAGKSSLLAAMHFSGAKVFSDDLTALDFSNHAPVFANVQLPLRIRASTLSQFRSLEAPSEVHPFGKHIVRTDHWPDGYSPEVDIIIVLEKHSAASFSIEKPTFDTRFALLRSELCSWEMLQGMPQTEIAYFEKVVQLVSRKPVIQLRRPENCNTSELLSQTQELLAVHDEEFIDHELPGKTQDCNFS